MPWIELHPKTGPLGSCLSRSLKVTGRLCANCLGGLNWTHRPTHASLRWWHETLKTASISVLYSFCVHGRPVTPYFGLFRDVICRTGVRSATAQRQSSSLICRHNTALLMRETTTTTTWSARRIRHAVILTGVVVERSRHVVWRTFTDGVADQQRRLPDGAITHQHALDRRHRGVLAAVVAARRRRHRGRLLRQSSGIAGRRTVRHSR